MLILAWKILLPGMNRCSYSYIRKPIRYVTIHLQDRRSAASLRLRNRAKITDLIMCKAKSHPIRF